VFARVQHELKLAAMLDATSMTIAHELLALNDAQLAIIRQHTRNIPYRWRERYLAGVADALTARTPLSNQDVIQVCSDIARAMLLGAGQPPRFTDDDD
jgi:hypothetical protein